MNTSQNRLLFLADEVRQALSKEIIFQCARFFKISDNTSKLEDMLQHAFFVYLLWSKLSKQKSHKLKVPTIAQIRHYIEQAYQNEQPLTAWLTELRQKRAASNVTPLENETFRALNDILGEWEIGERKDIVQDDELIPGFHDPFPVITTNEELAKKYVKEALDVLRAKQNVRYGKKADFALDELYVHLLHIYNHFTSDTPSASYQGKIDGDYSIKGEVVDFIEIFYQKDFKLQLKTNARTPSTRKRAIAKRVQTNIPVFRKRFEEETGSLNKLETLTAFAAYAKVNLATEEAGEFYQSLTTYKKSSKSV